MFAGEHFAGSPHPSLHFVKDQQRAELIAQFTNRGEIAQRRQNDATFTLDRFKDHRCDVITGFMAFAEHGAQGIDITEWHMAESRQQWHERLTEGRFCRGGQRPKRFAVEGPAGGDKGKFAAWRLISFGQF